MKPYFDMHHVAGVLTLVATLCWGAIEAGHLGRTRTQTTKVGGGELR